MTRILAISAIIPMLLLSSSLAVSAQMPSMPDLSDMPDMSKMPKIPGMPSMPKMVSSGKYTNAKWGLEVMVPNGYSGMEMTMTDSLSLSLMKGSPMDASGDLNDLVTVSVSKIKPNTTPSNVPDKYKDACKTPQTSTTDINGRQFTVSTAECTEDGKKVIIKSYSASVDGTSYAAIGFGVNGGNPPAILDDVAKSMKIGKADLKDTKKEVKKEVKKTTKDTKKKTTKKTTSKDKKKTS